MIGRVIAIVGAASLLTSCTADAGIIESSTTRSTASRPSEDSAEADLGFPGGGQILFRPQVDPGYEYEGVGIVSSNGILRAYAAPDRTFALWDPARIGDILLVSYDERSLAESFTPSDRGLVSIDSWKIDDGAFAFFSPDGRWLAETPFDRRGHLRTGTIRVNDRVTGERSVLRLGEELTVAGFSPDGQIVAAPWDGGVARLLNPVDGGVTGTLPVAEAALSMVVWSPHGEAVAGSVCCERSRVVVADASGELLVDVSVGDRNVSIPTWSPDGTRVAVVVRSMERGGHRTADLIVLDTVTGTMSVVDDRVSDAFWASWSPDGRWLLVDDWTRGQWLFVAADGSQRIEYPRLGDMARWCCPSSPPVTVLDPLC